MKLVASVLLHSEAIIKFLEHRHKRLIVGLLASTDAEQFGGQCAWLGYVGWRDDLYPRQMDQDGRSIH